MKSIIEKKIKEFETKVQAIEDEIIRLNLIKSDKEKHIGQINNMSIYEYNKEYI